MKKVFFKRFWVMVAAMAVIGFMAGCDSPTDPGNDNTTPSAITYTVAQTGGADGVTDSAAIVFTFSASVDSLNLTAAAITVSGKASKGTAALTGSGTSRTLPITVNAAGTAAVSIVKDGIETATKSVTVFKAGELVPETVTITWHFNGGTAGTGAQHPTQIDKGEALAKPSPDPAKDGNIFGGWYTDSGLTQAYNFANTVTANLSLYAKWEAGQINPSHTHQWGAWTATTIEGTEQRVCAIDQSHLEHRLTGTNRFSFILYSNNTSNTSYSISKGTATGEIYIPAYYRPDINSEYLPVTIIGDHAFAGSVNPDNPNVSLTAVHIPSTVTSIGYQAFFACTNLNSITIPEGVTHIGNLAFSACLSLTGITVDGNNSYYASQGGILYNKAKTTLIMTPEGKSGDVTIPAGVTSIGEMAFFYCTNLTSINIPEGVTSIGNRAFAYTSLTSITIPASVRSIGEMAFLSCTNLTSINILEGVTYIGSGMFQYCTSLTSINIPASVTSIYNYDDPFAHCTSLTNITVESGNLNYASQDGILYNKAKTTLILAPQGKSGDITIPAGVTSIGDGAFSSCTRLTSITIPAGVTSIGDGAFSSCTRLTGITIPAGVTSIGDSAFSGCTGFTSITIPASVTSIGEYAFNSCTNITSITIPESVTSVGANVFFSWSYPQIIYVSWASGNKPSDWDDDWNYSCYAQIVYQGQ